MEQLSRAELASPHSMNYMLTTRNVQVVERDEASSKLLGLKTKNTGSRGTIFREVKVDHVTQAWAKLSSEKNRLGMLL
jgi:hypothetical protein